MNEAADDDHGPVSDDPYFIPCAGGVVTGDEIRFTETVYEGHFTRPRAKGERSVTAKVIRDSYGPDRLQHTFTLQVIDSHGYDAIRPGDVVLRKGQTIYRNASRRKAWPDEHRDAEAEAALWGRSFKGRPAQFIWRSETRETALVESQMRADALIAARRAHRQRPDEPDESPFG